MLGPGLDPMLFLLHLVSHPRLRRRSHRADLGRRGRLDRQAKLARQDLDLGARRVRSSDAVDGLGVSLDLIHFEVLIRAASPALASESGSAPALAWPSGRHRHLRDAGAGVAGPTIRSSTHRVYDRAAQYLASNQDKLVLNAAIHRRIGAAALKIALPIGANSATAEPTSWKWWLLRRKRTAAFDQAVVAAGLSRALGNVVEAQRLPFKDYEGACVRQDQLLSQRQELDTARRALRVALKSRLPRRTHSPLPRPTGAGSPSSSRAICGFVRRTARLGSRSRPTPSRATNMRFRSNPLRAY